MQQKSLASSASMSSQITDLNFWLSQKKAERWEASGELTLTESADEVAEQEARWLSEQNYYQDQYLYADCI